MKVILFAVFYYELYGGKIFPRNGIIKMCNDFIKNFYSREKIVSIFGECLINSLYYQNFQNFFIRFDPCFSMQNVSLSNFWKQKWDIDNVNRTLFPIECMCEWVHDNSAFRKYVFIFVVYLDCWRNCGHIQWANLQWLGIFAADVMYLW